MTFKKFYMFYDVYVAFVSVSGRAYTRKVKKDRTGKEYITFMHDVIYLDDEEVHW